jgi:hypothetical protein
MVCSARGRSEAVQVTLLPRLLAPQRRDDDLEQRPRPRRRQRRLDRLGSLRMALPLRVNEDERLGSREYQVLPDG